MSRPEPDWNNCLIHSGADAAEITRAMRAAGRLDWYRHRAGGTILRYRRSSRRGAFHPVNRFHHQKNAEGDDQEIDQDVMKFP